MGWFFQRPWSKVPYFFSAEKFGGYTHTRFGRDLFFFSRILEKKKQAVFFFPWKSLDATHSPEKKSVYTKDEVTLVKRDKNSVLYRSIPWEKSANKKSEFTPVNQRKCGKKKIIYMFCFFSQKICLGICFFFPRKSLSGTHTLNFRGRKKKTGPEKKNTIFTNTHDFFKKVVIFKLFPGKKKYGTFEHGFKKTEETQQRCV